MSLLCKTGFYRQVFQNLARLGIPVCDLHLLFGPMDILCRFEFETMEEFKQNWFDRIRIMGGEEEWITQSMTFFVIDSGGHIEEKPFAFIFQNTHPRNLEKVQDSLLQLPQIMTSDTVFGLYDIISSVRAKSGEELENIIDSIQRRIPEIQSSVTSIVAGMSKVDNQA